MSTTPVPAKRGKKAAPAKRDVSVPARARVRASTKRGGPGRLSNASAKEIRHAAELANAHEFIMDMPDGYDTMVGERGVTLSGGQRQRIAIARAVIRDTPILILDEPTVGLDAASEQAVIGALDALMKGRTSVVIAHHLATIRNADVIFVINGTSVVEQGTHEALMKQNGAYAELYKIEVPKGAKITTAHPAA